MVGVNMLAMNHGNLPECSWDSPLTEANAMDADDHLQDCPHFVFSCRYVMVSNVLAFAPSVACRV
jgi:hypothetical protein